MKAIKNTLLIIIATFLSMVGILSLLSIVLVGIIFFKPTYIVNPKNINFALAQTDYLESWSWKTGEIDHQWIKWNHRHFSGRFKDFCLKRVSEEFTIDGCMEEVAWNFDLKWNFDSGFSYDIIKPLMIVSKKYKVYLKDDQSLIAPDYLGYWNTLWSGALPDFNFRFDSLEILKNQKTTEIDLTVIKTPKSFTANLLHYKIVATPKEIVITGPRKIEVPYDLKTVKPLYFDELKLIAKIQNDRIPFEITSKIANTHLVLTSELTKYNLRQKLTHNQLWEIILLNTKGSIKINKISETIKELIKPPFNILPAPLNSMEGPLSLSLSVSKSDQLRILIISSLDMKGAGQFLTLDLNSEFPYDLKKKSFGPGLFGIEFKKVLLSLPKLSKTKLPPRFKPDPRFKGVKNVAVNKNEPQKTQAPKKKTGITMELEATGENALAIKTNLLDEILRLNFKFNISGSTIQDGFIETKPLRTKVFKRQVYLPSLKIIFAAPQEPEIQSTIEFHLPEYLITLKLAGPLSKPRTAFSSKPPLPEDDIIAVLLFGRPLAGLNPEDKSATKGATQIISQGILSLAVLYYLAGSPVESIGYDPDSKVVSAQFGLGRKNSLRVESAKKSGGIGSYGIRHALGKGWYIDSTVEESTNVSSSGGKNLGVLLERIISY